MSYTPPLTNPNQPDPNQNPYAPQPQGTGSGAGLTQPGYLGAPSTLDMSQFSPNATIQELLAGFAPQAQSAGNNLNQTLADFGINGGQAVSAMSQLQAQLGGALAPSIAGAIQNSQGNLLQGGEFNAGATNATNAANVGQYNQSQQLMLQDLLGLYGQNFGAFNQINTGGQGAANQNANPYGQDITVTQNPWMSIFQGLMQGAGGVGSMMGGFSGGGGGGFGGYSPEGGNTGFGGVGSAPY